MSATFPASYALEAAGALLTAAIFGGLYQAYGKPFLREWALSWMALCIAGAAAAGVELVPHSLGFAVPLRLGLAALAGAAAYTQAVWLLFGSGQIVGGYTHTSRERNLLIGSAGVVGAAMTLVHATDPNGQSIRFLFQAGLRGVVVGLAFTFSAVQVWLTRGVRAIGRRTLTTALIVFGISQFRFLALGIFTDSVTANSAYNIPMGFAEFLLIFAVGVGVVIWLLEERQSEANANAAQAEKFALNDPLTGLPNRKTFLDHLDMGISQARRGRHKLAVLFVDLDRFKLVNDSLGHAVGDTVLQVVAARLRAALRETDAVARMGGDEFTVLAPVIHTVEDAISVARKILESVKEVITVEGRELFVTASVGIGMYPDDGIDSNTLLKNADAAMYRAKAQGADSFQLYTAEMNAHAMEQLALESALRRSVESFEFVMHYQPIVRTSDGAICSMEAMLRWKHPTLGLVRPEQFIRLAESTGLIVPIGEWALMTACKQLAAWRAEGFSDLRVAVNLSIRQLQQGGLVDYICSCLDATGLPASALEIEINETSASESGADAVRQLAELKNLGVGVSIDDFGTGYSSLSSLRTFPVDALKIDTTFTGNLVRDDNDTAIAVAVIALAHSLGLAVIAEGVEHPAQLEFLDAHRCEYWQGYLCSAPVDANEATLVLRRMSAAGGRILSPTTLMSTVGSP
jgi:diguanylate cyclase (GGDEF)-like protein